MLKKLRENHKKKRKRTPKNDRKEIFSNMNSDIKKPLISDYIRVKSPTMSKKDNPNETEYTITFTIPTVGKKERPAFDSDIDEADLLDRPVQEKKRHRLRKMSEISSGTDQIKVYEEKKSPPRMSSDVVNMNIVQEESEGSNFILEFSDSE